MFTAVRHSAYAGSYGFAAAYPLSLLTRSRTASSENINNTPGPTARSNLNYVSDWLASLPFRVRVTSGYRSPELNRAVNGARNSSHMTGLAVDFKKPGWSSRKTVTWFYKNRERFPQIDKIAWYTGGDNHVHVTLASQGSRGRQLFYSARGGNWQPWVPSRADLMGVGGVYRAWLTYTIVSTLAVGSFAAYYYWWRKR